MEIIITIRTNGYSIIIIHTKEIKYIHLENNNKIQKATTKQEMKVNK